MKLKRKLFSVFGCLLILWTLSTPVFASENGVNEYYEEVYQDGILYQISIDLNETKIVAKDGVNSTFILDHSTTEADFYTEEKNQSKSRSFQPTEKVSYHLNMEEFNPENVDIEIFKNDEKIDEINTVDELVDNGYRGQAMTTVTVAGVGIGVILSLLLKLALVIVFLSVAYVAAQEVVVILSQRARGQYYPAKLMKGIGVAIATANPITQNAASNVMRGGGSIYTVGAQNAYWATAGANLGVVGPELHCGSGSYFWHYHTSNRGAHAWYGNPA